MWTAGIVVMTLLVNAPLIPLLLNWTGLSQVSKVKAKIRAKAARAFSRFTENAIDELKKDEDEMLRGKPDEKVFTVNVYSVYTVCAQLHLLWDINRINMHTVYTTYLYRVIGVTYASSLFWLSGQQSVSSRDGKQGLCFVLAHRLLPTVALCSPMTSQRQSMCRLESFELKARGSFDQSVHAC